MKLDPMAEVLANKARLDELGIDDARRQDYVRSVVSGELDKDAAFAKTVRGLSLSPDDAAWARETLDVVDAEPVQGY
jgi:hypothetical protein